MKVILSLIVTLSIVSCQPNSADITNPCVLLDNLLNGEFINPNREGIAIFKGGLTGTADMSGPDYNDMTCTYQISNCLDSTIAMQCDGRPYPTQIIYISKDSFELSQMLFVRKKK